MRKIKFRGKRIDTGEWVYGDGIAYVGDDYCAIPQTKNVTSADYQMTLCKVVLGTEGQFTGLRDMNGMDIYEGDILRDPVGSYFDQTNFSCFEVFFHDGDANLDHNIGFTMNRSHHHGVVCGGYIPAFKTRNTKDMVVCGNVHDHPHLIKKTNPLHS